MDAVIMCSDGDPDPPNIFKSDKVTFLNWKLSDSGGRRLFSGGEFTEVSVWRADSRGDLFSSHT